MNYRVVEEHLNGVRVIERDRYRDDRGYFEELYRADLLKGSGISETFLQDNLSRSVRGVIRGLHYQHTQPQGKLLTVIRGTIQLVELDIRSTSPTYGQHISITISDDEPRLVWIPPGFANGFCCLSDEADVLYKCTAYYNVSGEGSIDPLDAELGIEWRTIAPILSDKDRTSQGFSEYRINPAFA